MRKDMIDAQEHVVALVYYVPSELSFESGYSTIPTGKAQIVACRSAYRGGRSGVNIMKGLFEMVHDRAKLDGATVMMTSGIPSYCEYHQTNEKFASSPVLDKIALTAMNMPLAWGHYARHTYPVYQRRIGQSLIQVHTRCE
jgi:hypothetical protein